ncbi:MAG TPA: hypothetical protein PL110_11615 [Candidatus Eremiobacteraeota bacterium]|nr:MAG: hypothetical protein BWY64_03647 [bacterium ADurb.Bin363]HPZ08755.1 hypothetical protein [Candidatus Eremiobacteraeota bacterium]
MKIKEKKIGLSLLEVIISIAIMGLLLSICSLILHWACTVSLQSKARGVTGNEALKSIKWLITDLEGTAQESLYIDKDSNDTIRSISFLSSTGDTADMEYTMKLPTAKWKNFVLYYVYPDPKASENYLLIRKTLYNDVVYKYAFVQFIAEPMKSSDVMALCNGDLKITPRNRIVARNIYKLELLDMNENQNSCTLKVITKEKSRTGDVKSEYTGTVQMKNSIKLPY